jgi:dTMP kinase
MAGFFLVLEGPEGAGKTTLARTLADRFRSTGVEPVVVREPGGTPAAEALRTELLDGSRTWTAEAEALYMVTARADLVARVIGPALAAGQVVISDRFDHSTRAYQIAGRGLPADRVEWMNRAATGGLAPDLTLILDLGASAGRARQLAGGKTGDRLDRESAEFHERVGRAYRRLEGPGIVHLDASRPPDEVVELAWRAVQAARPDLVEAKR